MITAFQRGERLERWRTTTIHVDVQMIFYCMPERQKKQERENSVNLHQLFFNYKLQIIDKYFKSV